MGRYQYPLWDQLGEFLDTLPEDQKEMVQNIQKEGMTVAGQLLYGAHHSSGSCTKAPLLCVSPPHTHTLLAALLDFSAGYKNIRGGSSF